MPGVVTTTPILVHLALEEKVYLCVCVFVCVCVCVCVRVCVYVQTLPYARVKVCAHMNAHANADV
jgi:hypothetical protein